MKRIHTVRILVFFVLACVLLFAIFFNFSSFSPPSPTFPKVINGRNVQWIPDHPIRLIAEKITSADVRRICLRGGGATGVPGYIEIASRDKISQILQSFKSAVTLKEKYETEPYAPTGALSGGPTCIIPADYFRIEFNPGVDPWKRKEFEDVHFYFYSDVYEGTYPNMEGGAVSPEFQDALRRIGIPKKRGSLLSKPQSIKWAFPQ